MAKKAAEKAKRSAETAGMPSDVSRFLDECKAWAETGVKCVAVNILLAPAEMEADDYAAIIAEKVRQAASGLTTSAMTFAERHRAKAVT